MAATSGDAPGLGVEIDEALAAQYPYQRAPAVNRSSRYLHSG